MTWNWAALIALLLAGGTALYIRLRWRRAPQAFTAMVAVAVCYFVSGAVLGAQRQALKCHGHVRRSDFASTTDAPELMGGN